MNNRINVVISVIVLIAVILLIIYFAGSNQPTPVGTAYPAPTAPAPATPEPTIPVPDSAATPDDIVTPPATSPKTAVVTYTDTGYLQPSKTFIVDIGTTVTFRNESAAPMWTASASHPTHAVYPTTGGCRGSTFDSCEGIPPGGEWSFRFDVAGTWKYHDHLHPAQTGTIVVR